LLKRLESEQYLRTNTPLYPELESDQVNCVRIGVEPRSLRIPSAVGDQFTVMALPLRMMMRSAEAGEHIQDEVPEAVIAHAKAAFTDREQARIAALVWDPLLDKRAPS
jgi:hypothetical protein